MYQKAPQIEMSITMIRINKTSVLEFCYHPSAYQYPWPYIQLTTPNTLTGLTPSNSNHLKSPLRQDGLQQSAIDKFIQYAFII